MIKSMKYSQEQNLGTFNENKLWMAVNNLEISIYLD